MLHFVFDIISRSFARCIVAVRESCGQMKDVLSDILPFKVPPGPNYTNHCLRLRFP